MNEVECNFHEKLNIVCLTVLAFVEGIRKKTALLEAFQNSEGIGEIQDDSFLSVVLDSTELQCILEIELIFDHPHFCAKGRREDNCSYSAMSRRQSVNL